MVRLVLDENLGYKSIADRLTAGGYPSPRGGSWAADTVRKILRNEALVGMLTYNKNPSKTNADAELVRVCDFFSPAILSTADWDAVHQRLSIRREHARGPVHASEYLLSGIARCGHCGGPMVGKKSYQRKGRQYANYWCGRAQRSRAQCAFYNGHSARKLEMAILQHLAQYEDPERVRQRVALAPAPQSAVQFDVERVERRLAELDRDFLANLDLLKRGVLDEQDFARANGARKAERELLDRQHVELSSQMAAAQTRSAALETLPARIRTFGEQLESMPVRKAKALLQGILLAAYVYRDNRIELEFRLD